MKSRHVRIREADERLAALEARIAELEADHEQWRASVEREIERLGRMVPQWGKVFRSAAQAERMLGEGVQIADTWGKPRDSAVVRQVLKDYGVVSANLETLREQRRAVLRGQSDESDG